MRQEWSVPPQTDWERKKGYPDLAGVSAQRWAWEFLARNKAFAEALKSVPKPIDKESIRDPNSDFRIALSKVLFQFGAAMGAPIPPEWGMDYPVVFKKPPRSMFSGMIKGDEREWFMEPRAEGQVPLIFDLRQPIEKQVRRARYILQAQAKFLDMKPAPGEVPHKSGYLAMLRILDARAAGAKQIVVARVLFPRSGPGAALTKVKRMEKLAKALRDGGYRNLSAHE